MLLSLMQQLRSDGKPCDAITIFDYANTKGQLDEIGGAAFIEEILETVPHSENANYYLDIVRDKWERRDLQRRITQAQVLAADPTRTVEEIVSSLDFDSGIGAGSGEQFEFLSSEQLANSDIELEYLIDWFLVKGQPCIVAGAKKTLKTNLLIALLLSLSDGVPFLGKFRVTRRVRAGLMSGESGQATIKETAERIAQSMNRPLVSNFRNAYWCFDIPDLSNSQHIKNLSRFIESNELEVLILDPAYLMMVGIADSAGNLFAVGGMLKHIAEIGQKTGCTILLCHHTKKSVVDPFAPPELEDIAWSGFAEFCRQWIFVGRRKKYDPEQGGHHELWLSCGGSAGHSGLWGLNIEEGVRKDPNGRRWDVELLSPSEARREAVEAKQEAKHDREQEKRAATQNADYQKIEAILELKPDGETRSQIRILAGMNSKRFDPIFDVMIKAGEVEICETRKGNGRSYPGFRRTRTHSNRSTGTSTQSNSLPLRGEFESECVSVSESVCDEKESEFEWTDERGIDEPF
jgi:hypothetical protein